MRGVVSEKLDRRSIVSYGCISFGIAFIPSVVSAFVLYFYTDIMLLPAISVSLLMLLVRFVDFVVDPFLGYQMDKRNTAVGKYRPYVLYAIIPFCLFSILLFWPIQFGGQAAFVWCLVIYTIWIIAFSTIEVAWYPLMITISSNQEQRRVLNSVKIAVCILAFLIAQLCTLDLVNILGNGIEKTGYFLTIILFAGITISIMLPGAAAVREHNIAKSNDFSISQTIRALAGDKRLIVVMLMFLFNQLGTSIKDQAAIYYMKYFINRQDLTPIFLFIGIASSLSMQPIILWASRRFSINRLMVIGYIGAAIGMLLIGFAGRSLWLLMLGNVFYGITSALPANLMHLHTSNLAEEFARERKVGMHGTITSLMSVASKVGYMFSGVIITLILHLTSYEPNAVQSDTAVAGIQTVFVLLTFLCFIAAAGFAIIPQRVKHNPPAASQDALSSSN